LPDPIEIPARACNRSFCTKHGGVWTSLPTGSLRISIQEQAMVSKYAFGTGTARFDICGRCGVVPVVTSETDGRLTPSSMSIPSTMSPARFCALL
jgi:hypothetical protein